MEIPGGGASLPVKNISSVSGRGTSFPLESPAQSKLLPLREGTGGIPLQSNEGNAISLKQENRGSIRLNRPGAGRDIESEKAKLGKAAEGFEAIFIRQFLKGMRTTIPGGSPYGSGSSAELYADMAENSIAEAMSKEGQFGIADIIYNRMVTRIESGNEVQGDGFQEVFSKAGGR